LKLEIANENKICRASGWKRGCDAFLKLSCER
jgi:hypothetical protein